MFQSLKELGEGVLSNQIRKYLELAFHFQQPPLTNGDPDLHTLHLITCRHHPSKDV